MTNIIHFTNKAEDDLRMIAKHLLDLTKSAQVVTNVIKGIQERCTQLEDFPYSGTAVQDSSLQEFNYRYLISDDYLIFYTYDESIKTVYVEAVINGRRDYAALLKNRD